MENGKLDKEIICKRCGDKFLFTAGEQKFYEKHGFSHDPKRCPKCRELEKNENITCPACGEEVGYGIVKCGNCNAVIGRCPHCNARTAFDKMEVDDPYTDASFIRNIGHIIFESLCTSIARLPHSPNYKGKTEVDKKFDKDHREIDIMKAFLYKCNSCSVKVFINIDNKTFRPWRN
jgi:hypothetical protein